MRNFLLAVQFLTVAPVRLKPRPDAPFDMSGALPWFPVVGALVGGFLAGLDWLLAHAVSLGVRNALLLVAGALLTGMLHLDGFVDCCDALLGHRSVEQRLDILRDSRIGAYGAIGAALLLITLFAALGDLTGSLRTFALFVAPLLGRWSMVAAVVSYAYARAQGAGAAFQRRSSALITASVIMVALLALAGYVTLGFNRHAVIIIIETLAWSAAITVGWTAWASRRLGGGLTGDTYGALNELVELVVFLIVPILWQVNG